MAIVLVPARSRAVVLFNIDWRTYNVIGRALINRPALRLTYDRGTLEIMTTSSERRRFKHVLRRLLETWAEERGIAIAGYGSMTFKRRKFLRGLEPDECYWIAKEAQMRGRDHIDLRVDPPPDLVLEIDIFHSSLDRMGIYGILGVPEVWRCSKKRLVFRAPARRQLRGYADQPLFPAPEAGRPDAVPGDADQCGRNRHRSTIPGLDSSEIPRQRCDAARTVTGAAMSAPLEAARLERAYQTALAALLAERHPDGYWVGELSTSALATAVAVSALSLVQKATAAHGSFTPWIDGGLAWLAAHQNADGGWGDTVKSFSNISTTMLCRAAFHLTGAADRFADCLRKADAWLAERHGRTPAELAEAVRARYGKDRTFSVPILMTSALAGLVEWKEVPSLPFELACFPHSWYRFLQIPVVSYALPALIAIGQAVYHHRPPWNPVARLVRKMAIPKSLRVLEAIQPSNGGFLEATPLTGFVTLALAGIGRAEHPVVGKAVDFLAKSVRPDGSWPIDTNLSTWVTTLSVNALAAAGDLEKLNKAIRIARMVAGAAVQGATSVHGGRSGGMGVDPIAGGRTGCRRHAGRC